MAMTNMLPSSTLYQLMMLLTLSLVTGMQFLYTPTINAIRLDSRDSQIYQECDCDRSLLKGSAIFSTILLIYTVQLQRNIFSFITANTFSNFSICRLFLGTAFSCKTFKIAPCLLFFCFFFFKGQPLFMGIQVDYLCRYLCSLNSRGHSQISI